MEKIIINGKEVKDTLSKLINSFIEIEQNPDIKGLVYQQKSSYVMGQISILTELLNAPPKRINKSYYEYLNDLIDILSLDVIARLKVDSPHIKFDK